MIVLILKCTILHSKTNVGGEAGSDATQILNPHPPKCATYPHNN